MNLLSDLCLNQLGCLIEKGRDRYGSYFLGLKIRGKGDEDAPLFVTGLFNNTSNTEVDIGDVTGVVQKEAISGNAPQLKLSQVLTSLKHRFSWYKKTQRF